jgi:N-glycosylase/DNA lyase
MFECSATKKTKNSFYESYYSLSFDYSTLSKLVPSKESDLLPGIKWGDYCQLYTPAFWKFMYLIYGVRIDNAKHRIGSNVIEEVVACLLGGYGMPSELGIAAFQRLKQLSLIRPNTALGRIRKALSAPFELQDGSIKRYRFYNQKSQFIFRFLKRKDLDAIPLLDDNDFRNWLLSIDGVGLKTASWITRNWLASENVAILDVHILRAGQILGIFEKTTDVSRCYLHLETQYINFCKALDVLPSCMDAIIWHYMKKTNKLALQAVSNC